MAYETKFEDGTEITSYLASAYAEGFCEGENASSIDQLKAWSYLCGTGLCNQLQGWFGRNVAALIDRELLEPNGTVDWDMYNELIQ